MNPLNGVLLDADSLHPADLDLSALLAIPDISWRIYPASNPPQVAQRIARAEIVLTNKAPLGVAEIEAAPALAYIGVLATGTNVIDLNAARRHSITITNISDYCTPSVVQHTFALILALTTGLNNYAQAAADGRWSASNIFCLLDFPIRELSGLTLGIIGYGALGSAVASVGKAFGMQIIAATSVRKNNSNPTPVGKHSGAEDVTRLPLDQFLRQADIISIHCPLTDHTRHLIGAEELSLMKADALLVNCARSGIVDEQALVTALSNGDIGGAALDVLSEEPPPREHLLLDPNIPNLIVTPHCAWGAREARQRLVEQASNHLQRWLAKAR